MKTLLTLAAIILLILLVLVRESVFARSHKQDIDMKKRRIVLTVLRSIALVFLAGTGYLIYETEYKTTEIETSRKEDYRLTIYQVGTPGFPFGPGSCRIVLSRNGKTVDRADITLHNDGKWPDETDFDVAWETGGVSVTVHGEEQEDMTYILHFEEYRNKGE